MCALETNGFKFDELNKKINNFYIKTHLLLSLAMNNLIRESITHHQIPDEKVEYCFRMSCLNDVLNGTSFSERQSQEIGKMKDFFSYRSINVADFFGLGKQSTKPTDPCTLLITLEI